MKKKKRKLKAFVLPTLYLLITISIFSGIIFLGSDYQFANKDYDYTTPTIIENIEAVIKEDTNLSEGIISPVEEGVANISIHYYNYKDTEEHQKNSLIFYENTYLPNTGILYSSDSAFDVKTVSSGKVIDIKDNELFGKVVVVEHSKSLKTYYYGLDEIEIEKDSNINEGTIIGKSKNNSIMNTKNTFLLEAYHNNELINPESIIGTKIEDYE